MGRLLGSFWGVRAALKFPMIPPQVNGATQKLIPYEVDGVKFPMIPPQVNGATPRERPKTP